MYGARYISDRFLPDKAIDLVDEAASALRLAQESKPDALEALDRDIVTLQIELESLKNETDTFSVERRSKATGELDAKRKERARLYALWQNERKKLHDIQRMKQELEKLKHELEVSQRAGNYERASVLRYGLIPELERRLPAEGVGAEDRSGEFEMLHGRVTSDDVARVVARATARVLKRPQSIWRDQPMECICR